MYEVRIIIIIVNGYILYLSLSFFVCTTMYLFLDLFFGISFIQALLIALFHDDIPVGIHCPLSKFMVDTFCKEIQ